MKKIILSLSTLLFCIACSNLKPLIGTEIITTDDGRERVENQMENFSVLYYGDYEFKKINKKLLKKLPAHLTQTIQSGTEIVYAAETSIEPFCATLGLLHRKETFESLTGKIERKLSKSTKAKDIKRTKQLINEKTYTKLTYTVDETKFAEYFEVQENKVFRIIFWTKENNDLWFYREARGILKSLPTASK